MCMKICKKCNKNLAAKYFNFCYTCNSKIYYEKLAKKAKIDKRFGLCKICGNALIRKKLQFCSVSCTNKAWKLNLIKRVNYQPSGSITKYNCNNCGKPCQKKSGQLKRYKNWFCGRECALIFRRKNTKNHLGADGYIHKGKIRLHREIMEKTIGRKLRRTEIVHHINHNKSDNRIENLELLPDQSTHIGIHLKERYSKTIL